MAREPEFDAVDLTDPETGRFRVMLFQTGGPPIVSPTYQPQTAPRPCPSPWWARPAAPLVGIALVTVAGVVLILWPVREVPELPRPAEPTRREVFVRDRLREVQREFDATLTQLRDPAVLGDREALHAVRVRLDRLRRELAELEVRSGALHSGPRDEY